MVQDLMSKSLWFGVRFIVRVWRLAEWRVESFATMIYREKVSPI